MKTILLFGLPTALPPGSAQPCPAPGSEEVRTKPAASGVHQFLIGTIEFCVRGTGKVPPVSDIEPF